MEGQGFVSYVVSLAALWSTSLTIVLSKLACMVKYKDDGSRKVRFVLDLLRPASTGSVVCRSGSCCLGFTMWSRP